MSKHNTKRSIDFIRTTYNIESKRKKDEDKKKEGNIKNIIKLLNNYYNHDDNLEDVSDYMVSSYKDFLIECIYKEIKNKNMNEEKNERKDDIIILIRICLKIIKNNHEEFKYGNIYFVCINTLFFLLNNIIHNGNNNHNNNNISSSCTYYYINNDDMINFMIYSCFDIFFNLISINNWTKQNDHIHIFSKLNFMHFFIISNIFKKLLIQTDDTIYELPFNYYIINMIIKNVDIYEVDDNIIEKNKNEDNVEKKHNLFNTEGDNLFIKSLKNRNNILQKKNDHIDDDNNIFPSSYVSSDGYMNDYYRTYKKFKRSSEYIMKEKKQKQNVDNSNETNIYDINSINSINNINSVYIINNLYNNFWVMLKNFNISNSHHIYHEIVFKIYSTIINLIINNDLTIYIINECVNIILNMCNISKQDKIIFDILSVYKFYIKNKQKMLERYIIFIFHLINKITDEEKKSFFCHLIKPVNIFFYLLQSECSEIRMCVKEYLLSHKLYKKNENNKKEIISSNNNTIIYNNDKYYHIFDLLFEEYPLNKLNIFNMTNTLDHSNICLQFVNSLYLIFFHFKYILEIYKHPNEDFIITYDLFFKDLGTDSVFKNYLKQQINMKKEKIFFKYNNIISSDKYIIIKNNIIEIEILIKTIDIYINFLNRHNIIKYLSLCIIYFIFFFIKILKYINKIYYQQHIQHNISKEFFFVIKNLFIQSIYVFEILIHKKLWKQINNVLLEYILKLQDDKIKNKKQKKKESVNIYDIYNIINKKYIINYINNNSTSDGSNEQPLNILIKKLYLTIINFLIPKTYKNKIIQSNVFSGHIINNNNNNNKNKNNDMNIMNNYINIEWPFFNISNFYFFNKLLLNISYFFYQNNMCENFMGIFFFDSIYKRIKEKIIQEQSDIFILLNKKKIHMDEIQNDNTKKKNISLEYKKKIYISYKLSCYISFCLHFLKKILLIEDKLYNLLNRSKYKKGIINICKLQLCMYEFFLPARSTNNGFSSSILVLYYLYFKIYHNKNKNHKMAVQILSLIFYATHKALNNIRRNNIIIYKNDISEEQTKKKNNNNNNNNNNNSSSSSSSGNVSNCLDLKTSCYAKQNSENQFIINKNFEKPFEEYYLNNSSHVFITGLNVLTNIIKLMIIKYDIVDKNNIIIKGSNILSTKKKKKKKKKKIITVYYKYLYKLYNVLMKKTKDDFFYSTRKYILEYIKHFIILNTVLNLKYKYRNNINFKNILSFCFYNLFTDYDVSVFSTIHSIAFCLKNYINLCSSKIKKSHHYLRRVDDLLFKVVQEYQSYDTPETNLWEEYISKNVSFETLKHTNVDCPGE
ncbi:conserved Plasmodium membrane protein, unknown function [Plasmodium sp. gorilla clade G2]|uniref:conserved Plasmodium membrane protein, unknown function n=1 Tax=Plasmodium sp. gorilla clade G2 TaxID=880535 RepID=UPI000D219467|nr:conserved Plasmodium membrane protein, unknown function [Plasmodium sp. gorilla clade G2]SOV14701.1 conserved Plasmodium membrane protein, unknown function [Plasmodium sp. gorilla clade G2]